MAKATPESEHRPLRRRLMWFAVLYCAGAAVSLAVAYGLRALILW